MSRTGWATTWRQRLRLAPLHAALCTADWLARWTGVRWPRPDRASWRAGLSVLVPERGTPDLLSGTLAALRTALRDVREPVDVHVVVNGAPEAGYALLRRAFPEIQWHFRREALGFHGAIAAGLPGLRHDWTYLLNSDMRLEPDALVAVLKHRAPQVFAVASQIFFLDPARRREETGWGDARAEGDGMAFFDREPPADSLARGSLYAGGGASLFRTALLRRYVAATRDYAPFYFEDADWSARAWAEGHEVVFCPASRAHHHHRATIGRYHDSGEVARIVARNQLLFDLRHGWSGRGASQCLRAVCAEPYATQRELGRPALAWRVLRERLHARTVSRRGAQLPTQAYRTHHATPVAQTARRPRVLLVTPFALFPPTHGGARRIAALAEQLAADADLVLLSDEAACYDGLPAHWFAAFAAVHFVDGRAPAAADESPIQHMQRHSHAALRAELARLIAVYDPDVVQVEFAELAPLVSQRRGRARWLLALHDLPSGDTLPRFARAHLRRYDAVTTCTAEDVAALQPLRAHLIPNGAGGAIQAPSRGDGVVLFMAPFRYRPNLDAARAFLHQAWPQVRAACPWARLRIVGGADARAQLHDCDAGPQHGVEIEEGYVDPAQALAGAALSINPQGRIQGSALKVIEALLAGRMCVSTRDGARGFRDLDLPSLCVVPDVAAMARAVVELLSDGNARHARERGAVMALAQHRWSAIAVTQLALLRQLALSARRGLDRA